MEGPRRVIRIRPNVVVLYALGLELCYAMTKCSSEFHYRVQRTCCTGWLEQTILQGTFGASTVNVTRHAGLNINQQ